MRIFSGRALKILICVALVFLIMESGVLVSAAEEVGGTDCVSQSVESIEPSVQEEAASASAKVTKGFSRSWIPVVIIGTALVALIYTKREKSP